MSQPEDNILVLVADDEPSTLALVASHVRSKGYKVFEASDGDQAWQLAHEHLPDLVVLDVMMPGMSGWEVCRKIREAVSLAHTGVIMLTGIGENLNEMTSPLYGADAYLDKPFEFVDLDSRVSEVLEQRRGGAMGRPSADAPRVHSTLNGTNGTAFQPPLAKAKKSVAKTSSKKAPSADAGKAPKAAPAKPKPAKGKSKRHPQAAKSVAAKAPATKKTAAPRALARAPAKTAKPAKAKSKAAKVVAKPAKKAAKKASRAATATATARSKSAKAKPVAKKAKASKAAAPTARSVSAKTKSAPGKKSARAAAAPTSPGKPKPSAPKRGSKATAASV